MNNNSNIVAYTFILTMFAVILMLWKKEEQKLTNKSIPSVEEITAEFLGFPDPKQTPKRLESYFRLVESGFSEAEADSIISEIFGQKIIVVNSTNFRDTSHVH